MQLPYANVKIRHWNPGASMPLTLPVHLICNTSDEEIFENIRRNSPGRTWLRLAPEHDGVAVMCGSGPSLADHIEEIRLRADKGQTVFAMNGAARYLYEHGITPDYQVIIDARPQTADLIGPARQHLFASQVSPECFRRQPDATLWHLQVGGIESLLPEYRNDYCLIGGAASVGNTATCLAFAMGFRDLQIYGYDSSHRDNRGHAFPQPMNDGDPCCVVLFDGKEYTASLTMKLQAEKFQETAAALIASGCKIEVHGDGLLPDMFRAPKEVLDEAAKYEKMWSIADYRDLSPGEKAAGRFIEVAGLKPGFGRIIDFGCGTGRGALRLHDLGHDVLMVDFASNCLDEAARRLPFMQMDLRKPLDVSARYGFCVDVMEHIPPNDVECVVRNILDSAPATFFQISTVPDNMGSLIGETLHLTVRPHEWWAGLFYRLGYMVRWQERGEVDSRFLVIRSDN